MATDKGTKRMRTESNPPPNLPLLEPRPLGQISAAPITKNPQLFLDVQQLDRSELENLVISAALKNREIKSSLNRAVLASKCIEGESRVVEFSVFSRMIWRQLNVTYDDLSESLQYTLAFIVAAEIVGIIKSIEQHCTCFAHPTTRFNGLLELCKIGMIIPLSANTAMGSSVKFEFQRSSPLEASMLGIIDSMKPEERRAIRQDETSPGALWPILVDLHAEAKSFCVFDDMHKVLKEFQEISDEWSGDRYAEEEERDNALLRSIMPRSDLGDYESEDLSDSHLVNDGLS